MCFYGGGQEYAARLE